MHVGHRMHRVCAAVMLLRRRMTPFVVKPWKSDFGKRCDEVDFWGASGSPSVKGSLGLLGPSDTLRTPSNFQSSTIFRYGSVYR